MIGLRFTRDRGLHKGATTGAVAAVTVLVALASALVALYLALSGSVNNYGLIIVLGINAVLVVGLHILVGNTGIMSFGQMAFVALGAYTAGILTAPTSIKHHLLRKLPSILRDHTMPIVPALLVAGLVAAVAALIIGPALMRLTGIAAGITTFGFLVIMNDIIRNAKSFTRGNETFFGVPQAANLPVVFGALTGAVLVAAAIKWSRIGLQARAVRDDPLAAETAGINIVFSRVWPWVGSAFISGVAGALLAFQLTAFSPNSFYLNQTIPIVVMVVLGGANSVSGAVVGAILLTVWQEFTRNVENGRIGPLHFRAINGVAEMTLGIGLILLLLARPGGVLESWEPQFVARRRGRPVSLPPDDSVVEPGVPSGVHSGIEPGVPSGVQSGVEPGVEAPAAAVPDGAPSVKREDLTVEPRP